MAQPSAGVLRPGDLLVSVSSGGQLVAPLRETMVDPHLRTQTVCHVFPGKTFCQAATLFAGLALRWVRREVLGNPSDRAFTLQLEEAAAVPAGADGLLFLPYLLGDRCPHPDSAARGVLAGLTLRHGRGHILRDALEVMLGIGVQPERLVAAGGGMHIPLWRQIVAEVLGRPLLPLESADQSTLGADMLAGISTGLFPDLPTAVQALVFYGLPIVLDPTNVATYQQRFSSYQQLYPASQAAQGNVVDGWPSASSTPTW